MKKKIDYSIPTPKEFTIDYYINKYSAMTFDQVLAESEKDHAYLEKGMSHNQYHGDAAYRAYNFISGFRFYSFFSNHSYPESIDKYEFAQIEELFKLVEENSNRVDNG